MSIITLTTDYGNKDYFVSSLKAKLISNINITNIVDISHEISPFNLTEAGYVLEGAFNNFPKGTTSPNILRPLITGREYLTSTADNEKSCLMLCPGLGAGIFMPWAKAPVERTHKAINNTFFIILMRIMLLHPLRSQGFPS